MRLSLAVSDDKLELGSSASRAFAA